MAIMTQIKLEAKARLSATVITAAPGDAKLIRKVFLKFGPALQKADKTFDRYIVARTKDLDSADDLLETAGERLQDWMRNVDEGSFSSITGLDEFVAEPGEGSHDLYGGMEATFGGDILALNYSLDINDPKKHDVSVSINKKDFKYVWASGKFDLAKYQQMVNKAMDVFEKEGFGGKSK